jgi:hypothetical protein
VGILIAPDGLRAFLASMAANKVSVIKLDNGALAGMIEPGREPDGLAWAGERQASPATKNITLQYRTKWEAVIGSGFVAVYKEGITSRLKITWDLPEDEKKRFDELILDVGLWARLDKNEPFIEGVPREKPPQAGFYPEDMTKNEFESWAKALPEAERKHVEGFF